MSILLYGLIGYPLGHSFSKKYFSEKFDREGIDARYELFPIDEISAFPLLWEAQPSLAGLNVTIPYKEAVIPYLDQLDSSAAEIGAVNCIKKTASGQLIGYNTDVLGFEQSLRSVKREQPVKAFILGSGGAAKSVAYVLRRLSLPYYVVSRRSAGLTGALDIIEWNDLKGVLKGLAGNPVWMINTTPLGMAPHTEECPLVPFDLLGSQDFVYDLIYNPEETVLLQEAKKRGCATKNGLEMLHLQADAAWQIWSD